MIEKLRKHHVGKVFRSILSVFLIYLICRWLFFWFNRAWFPEVGFVELIRLSFWGLRFDIAAIALLSSAYLVAAFIPFAGRISPKYQKFLWHLFFWPNVIGILLNAIDFAYYPYILQRSTIELLDFASREKNITGLISILGVEFWYVPVSAIALIMLFWFLNRTGSKGNKLQHASDINRQWYVKNTILLLLIVFGIFTALRGHLNFKVRPIGLLQASQYVKNSNEAAIVLNTPFSMFATIESARTTRISYMNQDQLEQLYSPFHSGAKSKSHKSRKNVVVIIMESFAKEYSGFLNPHLRDSTYKGYMPFLDSLMQHSHTFVNAYANGRKSIEAVPAIVASIPSFEVPYTTTMYVNNSIHSLPNLLKGEGYHSAFFHGAENGSMNFESFCRSAGFDKYYGRTEYEKEHTFEGNIWGVHDEPFLSYFADEMNQMPQPFFTTFFSLSSHTPFEVPEKHKGRFKKGFLEIHETIRYADFSLKKFFEKVKNEPWYNETIFVITADHCSLPYFPEYKNREKQYAIPLLMYEPGSNNAKLDSNIVQQLDIMPTILNKLGYQKDYYAFGTNMLGAGNSMDDKNHFAIMYLYENYQLIKGDYVLVIEKGNLKSIYNRKIDPGLKNNLKGTGLKEEQAYLKFGKAIIQQYNNRLMDNRFCSDEQ